MFVWNIPNNVSRMEGRKEGNVLVNDILNTVYIRLYGVGHMREETRCRHIGYFFRLTARVLSYAPSHIHDSTYHGLCCTSRGALAGTSKPNVSNVSLPSLT